MHVEPNPLPDLGVVIPTLNAAHRLPACLSALHGVGEIVIVDGGSSDDTTAVATAAGVRVVTAPRGRGSQLAEGARQVRGRWLLFLHADTVLKPAWQTETTQFMSAPHNIRRAAVFRFALDDPSPQARRLERFVAARCKMFALPYGDQGLLISRALYDEIGGFHALPLMEDVDIIRRLGRNRIVHLNAAAITSAERWRRDGWLSRSARNLSCLALYSVGVAPRHLARLYGR
jgi:rSAM/selenodomain-associated transferase 2